MFEIKCAWCGVTLRTDPNVENSHGICPACAEKILKEWKDAERGQGRFKTADGN